jgi:hypothetical protein
VPDKPILDTQIDFNWDLHSYIGENIRFSDAKAALAITVSSALLASLLSTGAHHYFFPSRFDLDHPALRPTLLGASALLAYILLLGSILSAVRSILPHLTSEGPKDASFVTKIQTYFLKTSHSKKGLIYWGDILAYGDAGEFWDALSRSTKDGLAKSLAEHVYVLAKIADRKFLHINRSILLTVLGGIFAGLFILAFK